VERLCKEEERAAREAEKEAERLRKEEERAAREAEKEALRLALEEKAKRQAISNFGVKRSAPAPTPEDEEGFGSPSAEQSGIVVRGGKRVRRYHMPADTTMAAPITSRPHSCAAASDYFDALLNFLVAGASSTPPRPPVQLVDAGRRRRPRAATSYKAWQYAKMKTLSFHEDVRPPYFGTFTHASPSLGETNQEKREAATA
jgi:hypothetical protein